jgi:chromosome segregation ATPase
MPAPVLMPGGNGMDVETALDQLKSNLAWLENERRKDKSAIDSLEGRLANLEHSLPPLQQQLSQLNTDLTRISTQLARFDQIENNLLQVRIETNRSLEAIEKQRSESIRELEKARMADLESINKSIGEIRRSLDPIPDLKKSLQARMEEDFRLSRLIEEVDKKITEYKRSDEEFKRQLRMVEESQRQDTKRLTDLQGEQAALRKRQDEQRGKVDLNAETLRKLELRLGEILAAETERRATQTTFIEKQSLWVVERDRSWKEMESRFEGITKQAANLDSQLQALDATQRSVKRSQEAFDDITQRFERRLNEITEMQRLVEDRFRQEWVAYKADDQKRWTNYTIAQEEMQREFNRAFEKNNERLVLLEDSALEVRDRMHLVIEEEQKRLQSLMTAVHEWVEGYQRTFGSSRE